MNRLAWIMGVLGLCIAGSAQAVVVDQFKCDWKLEQEKDKGTFQTTVDMSVPRLSVNYSPRPGVFLYFSRFSSRNSFGLASDIKVDFRLSYAHALEMGADGHAKRAVQKAPCLELQICTGNECHSSVCNTVNDPPADWDPFNDLFWGPVQLRGDVPLYEGKTAYARQIVSGVGTVEITCTYKDTLD